MKRLVRIAIVFAVILVGLGVGILVYYKANIQEYVDSKKNESDEKDSVASIAGYSLSKKEAVAYLAALRDQIETIYGKEVWEYKLDKEGTTYEELVKESLLEKIVYIKLVCSNANHYGVSLSSEDKVDVNGYVQKFFSSINEETASQYGLSTELMNKIYSENLLASKVYKKITLNYDPKLELEDCKQGRFYRMTFEKCYVDNNGNLVYYDEEELTDIKARANEAYQAALSGSFEKAAEKYNPGKNIEVTIGLDDLPSDIASTVMNLQEGTSTQILDNYDAYYIYYCIASYDEEATEKAYQTKLSSLRDEHFKDLYEVWYGNATININRELWDEIPLVGEN